MKKDHLEQANTIFSLQNNGTVFLLCDFPNIRLLTDASPHLNPIEASIHFE